LVLLPGRLPLPGSVTGQSVPPHCHLRPETCPSLAFQTRQSGTSQSLAHISLLRLSGAAIAGLGHRRTPTSPGENWYVGGMPVLRLGRLPGNEPLPV